MKDLHLLDEVDHLLRAAMLDFYEDSWVTGSYIKIGYFGKSDSDFLCQDEVDKTVDLIYTKYLIKQMGADLDESKDMYHIQFIDKDTLEMHSYRIIGLIVMKQ